MSSLSEVRSLLASDVSASGYRCLDYAPGGINPPVVVITAGDPWLAQGDTFAADEFVARFDLFLIAGTGTNSKALESVEEMAVKVLLNLPEAWAIDLVSPPYVSRPNDTEFLTCQMQVSRMITLSI
jgi:hypothetical protein